MYLAAAIVPLGWDSVPTVTVTIFNCDVTCCKYTFLKLIHHSSTVSVSRELYRKIVKTCVVMFCVNNLNVKQIMSNEHH